MKRIEALKQVEALISETYMYAVIIGIAAVVLAFIIANIIKWGGGKYDTSHIKRRVAYIIIGIIAPIGFFLYNALYVNSFIMKAPLQAKFTTANMLATLAVLGVYVAVGVITMLIMRCSKWGSILGQSKK
ncbi:MAG: hypothetical protein LBU44_03375 [Mediterranea sp.]|jgi:hypothetical protein|nr:hypothetical protein [Mediterranea sp.]